MPNPIVAMVGTGIASSAAQSRAASRASDAQTASAQASIEEQRRQFDAVQALMAPFVEAGTGALSDLTALAGIGGAEAQQEAIAGIEASPLFQAALQQGEMGILQNASATGGLRGGNTQAALAQFRPQLLSQAVSDQFSRLGSIASSGQSAAAGLGSAGMQSANSISNLLQQQGAAQAGGALAQGQAISQGLGSITQGLGYLQSTNQANAATGAAPVSLFGQWGF